MKDKKIRNIQSVYIPDDKLILVDELEKIRWREHKSMSDMYLLAVQEYIQRHKDGNEQMRLDSPNLAAVPQFEADSSIINGFMEKRTKQEESEFKFKIQEWKFAFKKRFGYEP